MSDTQNLVEESVKLAKKLTEASNKTALNFITNIVKEGLVASLNEDLSFDAGGTPSGFDIDGKQKRLKGVGDSLENKGDGPAIIEGDEPPAEATLALEVDDDEKEGEEDEKEENEAMQMPPAAAPKANDKQDGEDDDLDLDLNSTFSEEKEDEKEKKDDKDDEKKDNPFLKKENVSLKKQLAQLKKENTSLFKSLQFVKSKLEETALINQKMGYMNSIFSAYPQMSAQNKKKIAENFDKCNTITNVNLVYETVVNFLKTNSKRQSVTAPITTRAKQIVEAAQKNQTVAKNEQASAINEQYDRMSQMAGLND